MNIYVSKVGIVSSLGFEIQEHVNALIQGHSGIRQDPDLGFMLGKVQKNNGELYQYLNLNPELNFSRCSLLSMVAAGKIWKDSSLIKNLNTGLISSTCNGGLDITEEIFFEKYRKNIKNRSEYLIYEMGRCSDELAEYLGIRNHIRTISTACSSGANAIILGARLIKAKKLDRVIVGGVDPLTLYNIKGFNALGIYDNNICKPFDNNRIGLNLGEGAAYILLENEKSLNYSQNQAICKIAGWANTSDAFHQTASSSDGKGARLAMTQALKMANIDADKIGYINAHGTGTINNDLSESRAMISVFGENMPAFGSTKYLTGHTLGAAGAIEAVFSILALSNQSLWPMPDFKSPISETGLIPIQKFHHSEIEYSLSNSFGFGGNCSCLIFQKI